MTHPPIDQQITFLLTRDLAKTAAFYGDTLGLTLVVDQGICRIYRLCDGGYIGFCERETAPEQPEGVIFTIVTEAVDEWYHYLSERGVVFETEPAINSTYNIYHYFLRDPNGYLIEIQRFLDSDWSGSA